MAKVKVGLEVENKFLTDRKTLERLITFYTDDIMKMHVEAIDRDERINTYCDTKKLRLYKEGKEYRVRNKGDGKIKVDVKTPGDLDAPEIGPDKDGLMVRGEFSCVCASDHKALTMECFNDCALTPYITDVLDKKLSPLVKGRFKRTKVSFIPIEFPNAMIEIGLEKGRFYSMNDQHQSDELFIIEFEIKRGDREALLATIEQFKEANGNKVRLSMLTKGELGIDWLAQAGGLSEERMEHYNKARKKRAPLYTEMRQANPGLFFTV